jgi:hypothetical protein
LIRPDIGALIVPVRRFLDEQPPAHARVKFSADV